MGWDIGSKPMLKILTRHLLIINTFVFLTILAIFSAAVYVSVSHNLDNGERHRLQILTDTMISSIEPIEKDEPDEEVPDILQSYGNKEGGLYSGRIALQWFRPHQQLRAEKGTLAINVPFDETATFQTQPNPHALLLTRSAVRDGRLLGHLRVGVSLAETDRFRRNLITGLLLGTVLSLIASSLAILWLVRQSLKPVELSISKLSQFTTDASHELKNPLMAIKTNAVVALKYPDQMRASDQEKFALILSAAEQMINTTNGLLRLANAERTDAEQAFVWCDLETVLDQIFQDFDSSLTQKSMKVVRETGDVPLQIKAREDDIKIVLKNIIENAIKFSPQSGTLLLKANFESSKVRIEITDTGIGLRKDELSKIFDRFWRSDEARSHTSGGSGLGLSIVYSIVHQYNGSIDVKSQPGEGTTFTVFLPAFRQH
jgi:signal transduction histidine kinase